MLYLYFLTSLVLLVILFAYTRPYETQSAVKRLVERRKRHIKNLYGKRHADALIEEFIEVARAKGFDDELIIEVAKSRYPDLVEKLGNEEVIRTFGRL